MGEMVEVQAALGKRVRIDFPDGTRVQVQCLGDGKIKVCTPGYELECVGKSSPTIVRLQRGVRRSIMDVFNKLKKNKE